MIDILIAIINNQGMQCRAIIKCKYSCGMRCLPGGGGRINKKFLDLRKKLGLKDDFCSEYFYILPYYQLMNN